MAQIVGLVCVRVIVARLAVRLIPIVHEEGKEQNEDDFNHYQVRDVAPMHDEMLHRHLR